eukprot:TRINITY_DN3803_c0_g1_i1.p1 TRINITY_DN3803_c0_g1~~TRINITY_DN3803_c0_g1_i1.p1  ORF type:complete len:132 (+),score=48.32 TRINITY_DN3803_c0_g1_i1:116-511(+)
MSNPKKALYVGGLDEAVTEQILYNTFIAFGDLVDVSVPLDQNTQKNRGFAFIEFEESEDAAAALENMNDAELFGKILKINYSRPAAMAKSKAVWNDGDAYFEAEQKEKEERDKGEAETAAKESDDESEKPQ